MLMLRSPPVESQSRYPHYYHMLLDCRLPGNSTDANSLAPMQQYQIYNFLHPHPWPVLHRLRKMIRRNHLTACQVRDRPG